MGGLDRRVRAAYFSVLLQFPRLEEMVPQTPVRGPEGICALRDEGEAPAGRTSVPCSRAGSRVRLAGPWPGAHSIHVGLIRGRPILGCAPRFPQAGHAPRGNPMRPWGAPRVESLTSWGVDT